jgi:hypothetical protein
MLVKRPILTLIHAHANTLKYRKQNQVPPKKSHRHK